MKNKGIFQVLKKEDKFVITYIEKGEFTYLDLYSFDHYPDAVEYKDNHLAELDNYVSTLKGNNNNKVVEEKVVETADNKVTDTKETVVPVEIQDSEEVEEVPVEVVEETSEEVEEENKEEKKSNKFLSRFIKGVAIFMAGVILAISGFFAARDAKKNKTPDQGDTKKPTSSFVDTTVPTNPISNGIENIIIQDESYSRENIEKIIAEFAKQYSSKNVEVSTEDLIKFSAILNINALVEENKDFAKELFSTQDADEFINDTAKVIAITDMYNSNVWEQEKNADNFIWLSEALPSGTVQKEEMLLLEVYVRRIARASANSDKNLVNELIGDLIKQLTLPEGRLNAMDDGLEFAAQSYLSTITSSIAVNYIDPKYSNYFVERSSSETNVSNIASVYNGCVQGNVKTKTK